MVATLVLLPTGARPDVGDEAPSSQSIPLGEHVALSPVDTGEGAEPESPAEAAAIVADDPAAALLALSARRDRCLVAKSMDCLSGVHQWQSAAGAADAALLSAVPEGEAPEFVSFDTASLTTVQRTGDSAIVAAAAANDKPAPFLLMKGEAGWRLRDVFYR